jgi:hypothetical protein
MDPKIAAAVRGNIPESGSSRLFALLCVDG